MGNVDEQLKINIQSILCSISEDTVDGIIHALKCAGLETMSDLKFAQEDDLVFILKPIQRRKLIKAWRKQNLTGQTNPAIPAEDGQASSSKNPNLSHEDFQPPHNAVFWQSTGTNHQVQNSANVPLRQTVGGRVTPGSSPPPKPNVLQPKKFKFRKKRRVQLLKLFAMYRTEFLSPDESQKWKVWEKIAAEIRKYNPYCDALSCCSKIKELRHEYEIMKTKNKLTESEFAFLAEAKDAFETNENSGKCPNITSFSISSMKKGK